MTPPIYEIYQRIPGLVLGFHGCDETVGEDLLSSSKTQHLTLSENKYDWLGNGIYFWENDPNRAWEFAYEASKKGHLSRGKIKKPFVVGAVIELGLCLNLMDRKGLAEVSDSFENLEFINDLTDTPMPENSGEDHGARYLDCAVIQSVHETRLALNKRLPGKYLPYETVRAAFPEGDALYPEAGFRAKNHVQIAVRDTARIKGYFRPIPA